MFILQNHNLRVAALLLMLSFVPMTKADNITVNGTQRNYIVYAPNNLGEGRPLLISCHGMNQDANYQKNMLVIESVADTAKFVTVFPNGIDKGWDISGDRDINFVLALIDKMVDQYKIDRNRVYLSGFSMGGMFTYHAMNRIADKIAAFAPISGYPMGGTTANANVRPIPIIHTHGTGDDVVVFSGVQSALNAWINHNKCTKTPKVTQRYRGAAHITRRVWDGGENGVEVVLMEMADKGHWISNDNGVKTGDEIWKFCKRYSLEMKNPQVRMTTPQDGLTFLTFGGKTETGTITLTATASDPDGTVQKVEFFDGNTLIASLDKAPYTTTVENLSAGDHSLRAVATDDEGRTGEATVTVSVVEPTGSYVFTKVFDTEGSVPVGWITYDGKDKRTGYCDGFNQGCRVFHFTGDQHDFEWGLYARNTTGAAKAGYARFAANGTSTQLTLYPGRYTVLHKIANWNCSNFSPVRIAVEKLDGTAIHVETITPTSNIGNSASKSFSGTTLGRFLFDVHETTRCQITYYTADAEWADLVIGQSAIYRSGNASGIHDMENTAEKVSRVCDLQGRVLNSSPQKGLYIVNGKKILFK